jgi:hypothetical protein
MRTRSQEDRDIIRRGHSRFVMVELWNPTGIVHNMLPITSGEVGWSLTTANGVRTGRLTLPGYEWFRETDPGSSCWVNINITIGPTTWGLGQWPVTRSTVTRPGGSVSLQLGDWAYRRHEPDAESAATIGSTTQSIAATVAAYMGGVLPPVTVTRDDSGGAVAQTPLQIKLGDSVWTALVNLCNQVGCVPVMTSRQTVEIRNFEAGVAVEDVTGTVEKESVGILADEGINRVIAVVESSDYGQENMRAVRTLTTGPYKYDPQGFGATALVVNERTPIATQAMANSLADRTYDRRVGIVRSQSLELVPTPYLEVGDVVQWKPTFLSQPLAGRIEALTFPLTSDGTQKVTLRDTVIR